MSASETQNSVEEVLSAVPGGFLHLPETSGEWAITSRKGIPPIFPTRELGLERASRGKAKLIHARPLPEVVEFATPWHMHKGRTQVLFVLGGAMTTSFRDGSTLEIKRGDAVYSSGPHWHTHHSFDHSYEVLELISPPRNETVERPDGPPPDVDKDVSATWILCPAGDPYVVGAEDFAFGFRDLGSHPIGSGLLTVRVGRLSEDVSESGWPAPSERQIAVVGSGSARLTRLGAEPIDLRRGDAIQLDADIAMGFGLEEVSQDFTLVQISEPATQAKKIDDNRRAG
jgi:quercetin dioxygenase-like cupin family protein